MPRRIARASSLSRAGMPPARACSSAESAASRRARSVWPGGARSSRICRYIRASSRLIGADRATAPDAMRSGGQASAKTACSPGVRSQTSSTRARTSPARAWASSTSSTSPPPRPSAPAAADWIASSHATWSPSEVAIASQSDAGSTSAATKCTQRQSGPSRLGSSCSNRVLPYPAGPSSDTQGSPPSSVRVMASSASSVAARGTYMRASASWAKGSATRSAPMLRAPRRREGPASPRASVPRTGRPSRRGPCESGGSRRRCEDRCVPLR